MRRPPAIFTFLTLVPPTVAQECSNIPEWVDSQNNTCSFYSDRCGDESNALSEFAGYTGDTACCACGGGFQVAPAVDMVAAEDNGASVQDLQRTINVNYPGKAVHDRLADVVPVAPLPKWQLRQNRATISYLHWGLTNKAYDNYTRFYNEFAFESDEFGATSFRETIEHVELTFATVVEELPKTPEKEVNGTMIRMGDLGGYVFNHYLWDVYEDDWTSFPIGTSDISLHRVVRPLADYLMGVGSPVWSQEILQNHAEEFLATRNTLNNTDLRLWTNKLFHKLFLDIDMTDQDAQDFEDYKSEYITVSVLPTWLAGSLGWALNIQSVKDRRRLWINRYVQAIQNDVRVDPVTQRGLYAQFELEGRNLRYTADFFLTAFTAAGGISMPSTINHVLALVHGAGPVNLEGSDRILTDDNVDQFVLETIRYFPLVVGFPMWYPDSSSRISYAVGMAIRDPRVWDEPWAFKLRPLSEYHEEVGLGTKIGVGWAQQAKGYDGLTPDSRGCPAQDLSFVAIKEFMKVYMRNQDDWSVLSAPDEGIYIGDDSQANAFTIHRPSYVPPVIPVDVSTNASAPDSAFDGSAVDVGVISGSMPLRHVAVQAIITVAAMMSI